MVKYLLLAVTYRVAIFTTTPSGFYEVSDAQQQQQQQRRLHRRASASELECGKVEIIIAPTPPQSEHNGKSLRQPKSYLSGRTVHARGRIYYS